MRRFPLSHPSFPQQSVNLRWAVLKTKNCHKSTWKCDRDQEEAETRSVFVPRCCGMFPRVAPKTAVLCGQHGSLRSRLSARTLRAARRPVVQHQPASLPSRRLPAIRAHARVLRISQTQTNADFLSAFGDLKHYLRVCTVCPASFR